jgi:single-strand DNA-binding protein
MNEITLAGNIGKEPELTYNKDTGEARLRFSIAQNDRYFDRRSGERTRRSGPTWSPSASWQRTPPSRCTPGTP